MRLSVHVNLKYARVCVFAVFFTHVLIACISSWFPRRSLYRRVHHAQWTQYCQINLFTFLELLRQAQGKGVNSGIKLTAKQPATTDITDEITLLIGLLGLFL